MTDRIAVAIAGLGAIAQSVHIPLLTRRWDLFELAAVADLSPGLRDALGDQLGVPRKNRFADVDEMIGTAEPDAVVLLTSGSHGAAVLSAVRNGVPAFCEKPLAFTVAEADQLAAEEVARQRPCLSLGYMKEHDPAVLRLRDRIEEVDDIRAVDITVLHPTGESQLEYANLRPAPSDVDPAARERLAKESDQLVDAAIGAAAPSRLRNLYTDVVLGSMVHNTSLLRALFGGFAVIDGAKAWPDVAHPPSVEVTGWLPANVRVRVAWHYLASYPSYRETLTVHHAAGSLQVTFGTPYVLNARTRLDVVETRADGELRSAWSSAGEAFENELIGFHRLVTEQRRPRAGIAEGRADIVTSQHIIRVLADGLGVRVGGEASARPEGSVSSA